MSGARPKIEIAWERLGSLLADGLDAMLLEDWQAIESNTDVVPYAPDWDRLGRLDRQGVLKVLSARQNGRLIGLNAFMVDNHLFSKDCLHAFSLVLYVVPERRGVVGLKLIQRAERDLKALGVVRIFYASKPLAPRTRALLKALEYSDYEAMLSKVLR